MGGYSSGGSIPLKPLIVSPRIKSPNGTDSISYGPFLFYFVLIIAILNVMTLIYCLCVRPILIHLNGGSKKDELGSKQIEIVTSSSNDIDDSTDPEDDEYEDDEQEL